MLNFSSFRFCQEKMLNTFVEKKDIFFAIKTKFFESLQNRIFSKGLTHTFAQKMPFFSLFAFA